MLIMAMLRVRAQDWNDWKLDKASGGRNYFESSVDADNGDALSEDSGYHTTSVKGKSLRHVHKWEREEGCSSRGRG